MKRITPPSKKTQIASACETVMPINTLGSDMDVKWDDKAKVTPNGQLVFFAQWLASTGVFNDWVNKCTRTTTSNNALTNRSVLATLMLAILSGAKRYSHIAQLRTDGVASEALGISRIVSFDTVRRALKSMDNDSSDEWMEDAILFSVMEALKEKWILDIDTTIKTICGHQEGAVVSYNPHKHGRPSHAIHTFWVANLRMVLSATVLPGDQHASRYDIKPLKKILRKLGKGYKPQLVRGDSGYGNEAILRCCEELEQAYLLRLRQTKNVKKSIKEEWDKHNWAEPTTLNHGWQAIEGGNIKLEGWSKSRRIVLLRREVQESKEEKESREKAQKGQTQVPMLNFGDEFMLEPPKKYEYMAVVTNTTYPLEGIGQLYLDRCDCENGFDEAKNQWSWGGFNTRDLNSSQIATRIAALVMNWWNWYTRVANPESKLEAIKSRPMLLAAVGIATKNGPTTTLILTSVHQQTVKIKEMIANIHAAIKHVESTILQLNVKDRWAEMLTYISNKILAARAVSRPPPMLQGPDCIVF